jgi:hypothetical protein
MYILKSHVQFFSMPRLQNQKRPFYGPFFGNLCSFSQLFLFFDFLLLSSIASCAGEGIHAAMHFLILPEIYPARSRGKTHFRRCMFCTTSGLVLPASSEETIPGNIFTKIYSREFFVEQGETNGILQ